MPKGYLLLVLHAHLPYVRHPEYDRFLEERWFFEAVTETYIPLIKFFDRLQAEGVPFKLTLSISPTLANMMEDPLLRQRCVRHLDLSLSLAEKECERTKDWPDVNPLARMYRRLFEEARTTFVERCGTRLVTAFQQYAESGNLELITCAGTHGYLPLLKFRAGYGARPGLHRRGRARAHLRQQAQGHVGAGMRLLSGPG